MSSHVHMCHAASILCSPMSVCVIRSIASSHVCIHCPISIHVIPCPYVSCCFHIYICSPVIPCPYVSSHVCMHCQIHSVVLCHICCPVSVSAQIIVFCPVTTSFVLIPHMFPVLLPLVFGSHSNTSQCGRETRAKGGS
jgi:hypothetical protein